MSQQRELILEIRKCIRWIGPSICTIEVQSRLMKLSLVSAVVLILNIFCRSSDGDENSVGTFFQTHCVRCHDATTQEGGFRADTLTKNSFASSDAGAWEKVFDKVSSDEMPPKDEVRPFESETKSVLDWIGTQLTQEGQLRYANQGRAQRRRLNRIEFENTLRDLLHADIRVTAQLPEDGTSHGFSTVDESLTLSGVQMEKYLEAVDAALDTALGSKRLPESKVQRFSYLTVDKSNQFEQKRNEISRKLANSVAIFSSRGDQPPWGIRQFSAPAPGRYRIRVKANAYQSNNQDVVFSINSGFFFLLKGANKKLVGYYSVPPGTPTVIEAETYVEAVRDSFQIVPFGLPGTSVKGGMKMNDGPALQVHWIEIEGPLDGMTWPPESRKRLLDNVDPETGTEEDVHRILREFAPRAFRRPIAENELAPYLALASAQLQHGATFEQALRSGFKSILLSPRFLIIDSSPGRLDGYALASRLSFFLWSTMPDETLLLAASSGELAEHYKLFDSECPPSDQFDKRYTSPAKVSAAMPTDIPNIADFVGQTRLMFDLMQFALESDSTRIITFRIQGKQSVPPLPGVNEGLHNLSHHGKDPEKLKQLRLIELEQMKLIAGFLTKLKSVQENGKSLLGQTTVLYGSNLGNSSSHDTTNLLVIVAGGGFQHGQYLAYDPKDNAPLCNLYIAMLRQQGLDVSAFATSNATSLSGFLST